MPMGFSQMSKQGPRCSEDQFKAALLQDLLFPPPRRRACMFILTSEQDGKAGVRLLRGGLKGVQGRISGVVYSFD